MESNPTLVSVSKDPSQSALPVRVVAPYVQIAAARSLLASVTAINDSTIVSGSSGGCAQCHQPATSLLLAPQQAPGKQWVLSLIVGVVPLAPPAELL